MTPDEQVIYIKRQDEMNRIANFARAYANATPEQRARIPREDVLFQIERYKNLQNQQRLAEDQYQAQLAEQYRQQQAQANQPINTRWLWRKAPTKTPVEEQVPERQTVTPWTDFSYSKDQSFVPRNENTQTYNWSYINWPYSNSWYWPYYDNYNVVSWWNYWNVYRPSNNVLWQQVYLTNNQPSNTVTNSLENNTLLQWTYNPNARYTIWWQQLSWTVYWPITNRTYPSTTQFWRQYPLLGGSNRIAPYYNNGSYTIWWQPLNS